MSHDERPVGPDDAAPEQDETAAATSASQGETAAATSASRGEDATAAASTEAASSESEEADQVPADDARPTAPSPVVGDAPGRADDDEPAPTGAPETADDAADPTPEDPAPSSGVPETVLETTDPTPEGATASGAEPEAAGHTADPAPESPASSTDEPAPAGPPSVAAAPTAAVEEPEPAESEPAESAQPAESAPPGPAAPTPRPRPVPRPATPTPAAVAPAVTAPTSPVPPALTPAETAEAARWGRVDDDGTVWVREASGERVVGQYPDADPTEALAFYVRRYADLHAKVVLFEARLAATDLSVKEIDTTLSHLGEELAEPAAVGDLGALRERLEGLRAVAAERRAAAERERAAAREAALAERTAIVEAAEKIAATDPERMQWRPAGEQLRTLLDRWKEAQRHGPRLDRATEDSLWKRFSHARSAFDRERRRWFSELEKRNAGAKAAKEALVAEAERLSSSTDWGATSAAYRDLMTRWKAAGRASRKDDDALWARFRGAQDVFFAARDASQRQTDAEFSANLEVKLALLEEAERLVPVTDLAAAKASLRDIQDRWERAGKVPRGDVQRVEGRLRAVEQAVRDADQAQWRRTNPETRARAEGAAAQLHAAIAALEADLDAAKATGDARKVAEAQAALDARRAWLEQVERAAQEARG